MLLWLKWLKELIFSFRLSVLPVKSMCRSVLPPISLHVRENNHYLSVVCQCCYVKGAALVQEVTSPGMYVLSCTLKS